MIGRPIIPALAAIRDDHDEALLRWSLGILGVYLLVMLVPIWQWTTRSGSLTAMVLHVIASVIVALAYSGKIPEAPRHWMPLVVGPFLYIELRWLIEGAGQLHHDAVVSTWERAAFPMNPSQSLVIAWPWMTLSEALHTAYLSYYALIFVPPALLWRRRGKGAFSATLLALAVVYALCFTIYVLFPVDGPRFLHGPAAAPNGPIRSIVIALLESGSSRGTAFPSSHVAASVVASVCALRFQRPVGIVAALLTAGICIGAVYGGYHYAVDILAGLLTGAVAILIALTIENRTRATT